MTWLLGGILVVLVLIWWDGMKLLSNLNASVTLIAATLRERQDTTV